MPVLQEQKSRLLYRKHHSALKRQGKAESTLNLYSHAIRRVCESFDCPPDTLTHEQLEGYFESLISTQKSFKAIVTGVGIHKDITIHSLRHCYGTLLTDAGVSLRAIQEQMGHECPKTTALYTQLSTYSQNDTDRRINGLLNRLRVTWGQ